MQENSGDSFQSVKDTLDNARINWLQVHGLKDTEAIREICSHFEIDFLVLQDILNANHPTKIEEHDKYIVLILKLFYPNVHKEEDELDELLQQQVCIILGSNYVLTFLEKETDFFDDVNAALRNDVLKIRSRQTDYLLSVLLNSVMANYISTISSIDDAPRRLGRKTAHHHRRIRHRCPDSGTPAPVYADEEIYSSAKRTVRETATC